VHLPLGPSDLPPIQRLRICQRRGPLHAVAGGARPGHPLSRNPVRDEFDITGRRSPWRDARSSRAPTRTGCQAVLRHGGSTS